MRISDWSSDVCSSDLPEVAKACSAYARGAQRLALICHSDDDLRKKLEQAIEKIERTDAKPFKTRAGVHYGVGDPAGKLCLLFPGEGSQYPDMLAELCVHFPQVRDWFDFSAQIGRASGRDRGCQYGLISVVAVSLKK